MNRIYGAKINKSEQHPQSAENEQGNLKKPTEKTNSLSGSKNLRVHRRTESQQHEQNMASNEPTPNAESPSPSNNIDPEHAENTNEQQPVGRHCLPTIICERRKSVPEPLHQTHQLPGSDHNQQNDNQNQPMCNVNENRAPLPPVTKRKCVPKTNPKASIKPSENIIPWHHPHSTETDRLFPHLAAVSTPSCKRPLRRSQDFGPPLPPSFLPQPPYNRYTVPQSHNNTGQRIVREAHLFGPTALQHSATLPQRIFEGQFQNNQTHRLFDRPDCNSTNRPGGTQYYHYNLEPPIRYLHNMDSNVMPRIPIHSIQILSRPMPQSTVPGHASFSTPQFIQQTQMPRLPSTNRDLSNSTSSPIQPQMPPQPSTINNPLNSASQSLQQPQILPPRSIPGHAPIVPSQIIQLSQMQPLASIPDQTSNFTPQLMQQPQMPQSHFIPSDPSKVQSQIIQQIQTPPSIPGQPSISTPQLMQQPQMPPTPPPSSIPYNSSNTTSSLLRQPPPKSTPPRPKSPVPPASKKAKTDDPENVTPNNNFNSLMVMMESIQNAILTQKEETMSPEQLREMRIRVADMQKLMNVTKSDNLPEKHLTKPTGVFSNTKNTESVTQSDLITKSTEDVKIRTPSVIMKVDHDSKVSGPVPVLVLKDKPKIQQSKEEDNLRNRKTFAGENQLVVMNTGKFINYAPMVQFNDGSGSREFRAQSGTPTPVDVNSDQHISTGVDLAHESKKMKMENVHYEEIDREDINVESSSQLNELKVSADPYSHLKIDKKQSLQEASNSAVFAVTTAPKAVYTKANQTYILPEKTSSSSTKKVLVPPVNIKATENRIVVRNATSNSHPDMHTKNCLDPSTIKEGTLTPEEYVEQMETLKKKNIPQDFIEFYIYITRVQILRDQNPINFDVFLELHNGGKLGYMYQAFERYRTDKLESETTVSSA